MAAQQWAGPLAYIITPGTQYNTYTTSKSVLGSATATAASAGVFTLPAGALQTGSMLTWKVWADISNRVTGPDTFTINIMFGAVVAFTTGAINLTTTAHTNIPAVIDIVLTCEKIGNGTLAQMRGHALIDGQMIAMAASLADGAANTGYAIAPNTATALGTGFDSTAAQTVDFAVAQSFSGAGNGISITQYLVRGENLMNMS